MKQPRAKALKIDHAETTAMHRMVAKRRAVKITVNIDTDSLTQVRRMASKSGIPYQRLLNLVLKEGLAKRHRAESRLDRLEREVRQLKKAVAA